MMLKTQSRTNCDLFDDFLVEEVFLEDVLVLKDKIEFVYIVEEEKIRCCINYKSVDFTHSAFKSSEEKTYFAVLLAMMGSLRFGAVLPKRLNFSKYSQYIEEEMIELLKIATKNSWSEHRYQLGKVTKRIPEFIFNSSEIRKDKSYPLWSIAKVNDKPEILLASGSGKDSLLCSLI